MKLVILFWDDKYIFETLAVRMNKEPWLWFP